MSEGRKRETHWDIGADGQERKSAKRQKRQKRLARMKEGRRGREDEDLSSFSASHQFGFERGAPEIKT